MPNIGKQILMLGCLIIAFMAAISIISSPRNAVGELFYYSVIGSGLICLLNPKRGVYIVLFYTVYLDFFKRLLPLGGGATMQDVLYSMAIAPVSALAVTIGVVLAFVFDRVENWSRYRRLFTYSILTMVVMVLGIGLTRFSSTATAFLREIANYAGYIGLMLAIPCLFPTRDSLQSLLKYLWIIFIPVPLYFFYQYNMGLMWWEDVYLKSGLSLEARQFDEYIFRYFSTMNNAQSLSTMMCLFAVLIGLMHQLNHKYSIIRHFRPWPLLLASGFFACSYYTFSRGGWIAGLACLGGLIFFRSKASLVGFYGIVIISICLLFGFSGTILKQGYLVDWSADLAGDDGGYERNMATRLGTFGSRLMGMENMMTKARMWEPFGVGVDTSSGAGAVKYYTHDFISSFIVNQGYVPAIVSLLFLVFALNKIHGKYFHLKIPFWQNIGLIGLAGCFGIFIGSIGNAAQLGMFPVNVYFWFFAGLVASALTNGMAEASPVEVRSEVEGADSLSLRPGRGLVRHPA